MARRDPFIGLLVGLILAQAVGVGIAQPAVVAEGHRLAEQMCSQCHLIKGNGGSWTTAPSFESVANSSTMSQRKLTDFIMKPHFSMPPRDFTQAQASAIASYILSLRHR
jgi:cytochrome c